MSREYVPPEINVEEKGVPLIVGRDPGETEVEKGKPFVGKSGRLLFGGYDPIVDDWRPGVFKRSGLRREDVNIVNRVPYRPPGNNFPAHYQRHIDEGWEELVKLIDQLEPSIIVACGNEAAYDLVEEWPTLTDKKPNEYSGGSHIKGAKRVTDRRGFFFPCTVADCPVLPTLHPASCLYQPVPYQMLLEFDFMRMRAWLEDDPEMERVEFPEPSLIRVGGDVEPLYDSDLVAFDIEVTENPMKGGEYVGQNRKNNAQYFLCIAFCDDDLNTYLAYPSGLEACKDFLASDVRKVAHNFQFDKHVLQNKMGIEVGGRIEDTQAAHWACYPELAGKEDTGREDQSDSSEWTRKGLNFLASWHRNYPWWKSYTTDRRKMGILCANDVYATRDIWNTLEEDMEHFGVRHMYEDAVEKMEIAIRTQAKGLNVDEPLRQERLETIEGREEKLTRKSVETAEEFLKEHDITHDEDGNEYWWFHAAQCTCCNGGKKKSQACPSCAGITPSGASGFLVSDYREWAEENTDLGEDDLDDRTKEELRTLLPVCRECEGEGKVPTWDFNPMSPTQLPEILWNHLNVPAKCHGYTEPDAQEETIREVLQWARS